ncbi:MAG: DUF4350 domain-containing protein, partial [Candidatus Lokiarchaeota archaeon]|nr:DUF4350 domain-containing protein [Candidatus Lokiarchaeota archaeon]
SYGAGSYDFLLVEFTTAGSFVRYNTWGTSGYDYGMGVTKIDAALYIGGYTTTGYEIMLVKLCHTTPSSIQLLSPPAGATFFCGNVTFTWSSMEFPLGLVNYTWQFSGSPTFSTILSSETGIPGSITTTSTTEDLNYTSGAYYWRVAPSYGKYTGKYSAPALLNLIRNYMPPQLTGGSVSPIAGNQMTDFTFQVTYTDGENNAPLFVLVIINGTSHLMSKLVPADTNYVDGCTYTYTAKLIPGWNPFTFSCSDGRFTNATTTNPGPTVILENIYAPMLGDHLVSPTVGYTTTTFTFSVTYYDGDNNTPSFVMIVVDTTTHAMAKQTPGDTNYFDGCIYTYSTTLPVGTHSYRFMASDGNFSTSLGPFGGPVVSTGGSVPPDWGNCRLDGVRIGAVITHGEYNPRTRYTVVATALQQRGAIFTDVSSTITAAVLANYDVLWIDGAGSAMASAELDAIVTWMNNGGRLLVSDDYTGGSAASVLGRYSVYYTSSSYSGIYASYIYSHAITTGVSSLYFSSPSAYINIASQPSAYLCARYSSSYNLVVSMNVSSTGRMVVITDEAFFTYYSYGSNYRLINNTFGWLGHRGTAGGGNAPVLTSPSVAPASGNQYTTFQFRVTYTDAENNEPAAVNAVINGTAYPMVKLVPSDTTYTDGCVYVYSTSLSPGNYEYYFVASDGTSPAQTGLFSGPTVSYTANPAPSLSSPSVNPGSGHALTAFTFSVTYSDSGNEAPTHVRVAIDGVVYDMAKRIPGDNYYIDGCIYDHTTLLPVGTHNFLFSCSDGLHVVNSSMFLGLTVEPIAENASPLLHLAQVVCDTQSDPAICTFRVIYQDLDNDMPSYVHVFVDGVQHGMYKEVSTDVDYTDGCAYVLSLSMAPGTHAYHYAASDALHLVTTPDTTLAVPEPPNGVSAVLIPWLVAIAGIGLAVVLGAYAFVSRSKAKNATILASQARTAPPSALRSAPAPAPPPSNPPGTYTPGDEVPYFDDEIEAVISGKVGQAGSGATTPPRAKGISARPGYRALTAIDEINKILHPLVEPSTAQPDEGKARAGVAPPAPAPLPPRDQQANLSETIGIGLSPKRIDASRWVSGLPTPEETPASVTVKPFVEPVPIIVDTEVTREIIKDATPIVVDGREIDVVADLRSTDLGYCKRDWYSGPDDGLMANVIHQLVIPHRSVLGDDVPLREILAAVRAMAALVRGWDTPYMPKPDRGLTLRQLIDFGGVDTAAEPPHLTEKGLILREIALELSPEQVRMVESTDYSDNVADP